MAHPKPPRHAGPVTTGSADVRTETPPPPGTLPNDNRLNILRESSETGECGGLRHFGSAVSVCNFGCTTKNVFTHRMEFGFRMWNDPSHCGNAHREPCYGRDDSLRRLVAIQVSFELNSKMPLDNWNKTGILNPGVLSTEFCDQIFRGRELICKDSSEQLADLVGIHRGRTVWLTRRPPSVRTRVRSVSDCVEFNDLIKCLLPCRRRAATVDDGCSGHQDISNTELSQPLDVTDVRALLQAHYGIRGRIWQPITQFADQMPDISCFPPLCGVFGKRQADSGT